MSSKFKIIYPNTYYFLEKKQFKKFLKINDCSLYECLQDRKGGNFLVGIRITVKEWIEKFFSIFKDTGYSVSEVQEMKQSITTLLMGNEESINLIGDYFDVSIKKYEHQKKK